MTKKKKKKKKAFGMRNETNWIQINILAENSQDLFLEPTFLLCKMGSLTAISRNPKRSVSSKDWN